MISTVDNPHFILKERDPTQAQMIQHLRRANAIAIQSGRSGHHPFGAILIAADHETILFEQGNVDTVKGMEGPSA